MKMPAKEGFEWRRRESNPRKVPTVKRPRRSGSFHCAYCERYQRSGGEFDHAPTPARHGGERLFRVCLRCHDLKDRLPLSGWTWEEASRAISGTAGLEDDHLETMEAFSAAFRERDAEKLPDVDAVVEMAMAASCAETRIYILKGYAAMLDCFQYEREAAA